MSITDEALTFSNPYRPGAGHMPPHLAGREMEYREFDKLLGQGDPILENLVLTGLRGVGKTVLLDTFKPRALQRGWLWVGADLSESASVTEESLALRLITDLSVVTSTVSITVPATPRIGFGPQAQEEPVPLTFEVLCGYYANTPGLTSDKLKAVLELAWHALEGHNRGHVVFAYDEAQNLADHADKEQFPLSLLLDVFQSLQKKGAPFLLVLTGLPTLFPKLVEARTFAERMFRVITLGRLNEAESREAILKPLDVADCPIRLDEVSVSTICSESGGYPYFIQFICREVFDIFIQQMQSGGVPAAVPVDAIQRKLDTDFFAGRWARATDRQRQLLYVISLLDKPDEEFTIQEVVAKSKLLARSFSTSHVNQMLVSLAAQGLVYKNRFGRYSLAVPLLSRFILRTYDPPTE
jgi:KaiC/GvpD/RAD55 family RecA-like ATPase